MSFDRPLALIALVVVPVAGRCSGALLERRRTAQAARFSTPR